MGVILSDMGVFGFVVVVEVDNDAGVLVVLVDGIENDSDCRRSLSSFACTLFT